MSDKITIISGNNSYEFPVIKGSENEEAIDIKVVSLIWMEKKEYYVIGDMI